MASVPLAELNEPDVSSPLPGPRAAALIAGDQRYTSPSYTRAYPLAVARGGGAILEDVDGNRFLDFTAGIAVCSTGHCHPRIVQAIQEQAGRLLHMSGTDFYYAPQRELAERLALLAGGADEHRVFFTNSGAESVEAAIKLARFHSGRPRIVAFRGAFHGRTLGALSLTGSKIVQRQRFGPLLPGVVHIPYPNCRRCPRAPSNPPPSSGSCCLRGLDELEHELFQQTVPPDEVAAVVVEPIQGEGGYLVPPAEFHQRLREITQRHGILLIADEVQAGMGRTGKMFAMQHFGVQPDIICLAKGIGSGMPLGAIVARTPVMNWPPGSHASTFGGNPVCCAAALETIRLLEESLLENAAEVGGYLRDGLSRLAEQQPAIFDVRGKGLMIGVELARPDATPDPDLRNRVIHECFHRGLLLLGCGASTLRFSPPLVIRKEQVDTALKILAQVFSGLY